LSLFEKKWALENKFGINFIFLDSIFEPNNLCLVQFKNWTVHNIINEFLYDIEKFELFSFMSEGICIILLLYFYFMTTGNWQMMSPHGKTWNYVMTVNFSRNTNVNNQATQMLLSEYISSPCRLYFRRLSDIHFSKEIFLKLFSMLCI